VISILKTFFVCVGVVAAGTIAVNSGSYLPVILSGIGLFGYMFCEFFILRPVKREE
jgi:hypothetical protein